MAVPPTRELGAIMFFLLRSAFWLGLTFSQMSWPHDDLAPVLPAAVHACPLCKEAISSGGDDDEINNAPLAYNQSIYLMAGTPYALLGVVGFFIYRGVKKNGEHLNHGNGPDPV